MPRSGLAGAMTAIPCACSSSITPLQLEPSANAPWTRTTVRGAAAVGVASVTNEPSCVLAADDPVAPATFRERPVAALAIAALVPTSRPTADRRDKRCTEDPATGLSI